MSASTEATQECLKFLAGIGITGLPAPLVDQGEMKLKFYVDQNTYQSLQGLWDRLRQANSEALTPSGRGYLELHFRDGRTKGYKARFEMQKAGRGYRPC